MKHIYRPYYKDEAHRFLYKKLLFKYTSDTNKHKCRKEKQGSNTNSTLKNFIKDFGQIITGFCIFLVSCFLAYIASEQTKISQNVASITKNATRPYLVIDDVKLKELIVNGKKANFIVGKKFVVTLTIRNKGQTPAYEVIDFMRIDILEPNADLPMPPSNKSKQYIAGNDIKRFKQSERVFRIEDSNKINNNKSWLYFWGKVKYVDVSGVPYYVEFGYRYIFTHKEWFPYEEYNRAN